MRLRPLIALFLVFLPAAACGNPFLQAARCASTAVGVSSSAVVDTGAACADSTSGQGSNANQIVYNLLQYKSPAETKAEDSCPLVWGASAFTTGFDPSFVGRAGHKGSYYAMGSGVFTYPGAPVFENSWGKTTGFHAFTYVVTFRFVHTGVAQTLMASKFAGSNKGIFFFINSIDQVAFLQRGDTANMTQATNTNALVDGNDYIAAVSYDGTTVKIWAGQTTAQSFTRAYNSTSSDPSGNLTIGCLADGTACLDSATRIYDPMIAFDVALNDTDMGNLVTMLNARNGLTFTH
jgi:hypothetical protein